MDAFTGAIIGTIVVVFGWGVVHHLTLDAQRKQFRHEVLDRARVEITQAIRESQDWHGKLQSLLASTDFKITTEQVLGFAGAHWDRTLQELLALITDHRAAHGWDARLEE
jgi:hypothetical protein